MPWKAVREDGQYVVRNKETGRKMGTHPSKAAADAQVNALYANVPEARRR